MRTVFAFTLGLFGEVVLARFISEASLKPEVFLALIVFAIPNSISSTFHLGLGLGLGLGCHP